MAPTFAKLMNSKATCLHCVVVRIMQILWTFWFKALDLRTHLGSWLRVLVFKMYLKHSFSSHCWLEVGREIGRSASLCHLLAPTTLEGLLHPRVRTRSQDHNLRIHRSCHLRRSRVTENISNNPLEQGAGHGQEEEHETQKNDFCDMACCGFCFASRLLPFLISCCEGFENPGRGRPTTGELANSIASNGCSMLFQRVPHPWWNTLFISLIGHKFILLTHFQCEGQLQLRREFLLPLASMPKAWIRDFWSFPNSIKMCLRNCAFRDFKRQCRREAFIKARLSIYLRGKRHPVVYVSDLKLSGHLSRNIIAILSIRGTIQKDQ